MIKKIYPTLLFLAFVFLNSNAQIVRDKPKPVTPVIYADNASGDNRGGSGNIGLGVCGDLFTVDTATNGNDGVMFEITAVKPIVIKYFDCLLEGGTGNVKIFYKNGSYSGFTSSASGWTFADSALVVPAVNGFVRIPINLAVKVGALQTVSFYITGINQAASVKYDNGTTEGNVFAQNADLAIKEGIGIDYPFGGTFAPRVFRGVVYYCLDTPTVCRSLTTTLAGGNGSDGAMFSVQAKNNDLLIESILPVILNNQNFSVYYKPGTFVGFEGNAASWTFIDSAGLTSPGSGQPAPGFKNLNVLVPANQKVSFYVTDHTGGSGLDYTDGTLLDSLFASDNFIQFFEGEGIQYPFGTTFSPRIFNGLINYCYLGDTISPSLNITTSASNPTSAPSVPLTFTFSKSVTGFDLSDILVSNGSITPLGGSGTTYTSALTFTAAGLARVIVPAGAGIDQSGNPSLADTLEIVYTPVGITDMKPDSRFVAGFNAGTETVYAATFNGEPLERIELYNLQGALMMQAAPLRDSAVLEVSSLAAGVYICAVSIQGVTHNRKLTIY